MPSDRTSTATVELIEHPDQLDLLRHNPALIDTARDIAARGGCTREQAERFVADAVGAFALSHEPVDRAWYAELTAVGPAHVVPLALDVPLDVAAAVAMCGSTVSRWP